MDITPELVIRTRRLFGTPKPNVTCVGTNRSHLTGLSKPVYSPVITLSMRGTHVIGRLPPTRHHNGPNEEALFTLLLDSLRSVNAVLCHFPFHEPNLFWVLSHSAASITKIMYWECASCLSFFCKLHRKACWRCPLQLLALKIEMPWERK